MSIPVITLLLLAGATLQTLLPQWAWTGSLEWPLLTGLLVTISLRTDRRRLIYASLMTGLLYDAFSPAPLGISMPFFLLLGMGVYALREELFADHVVTYCILGLLAVPLKTLYFTVVLSVGSLRPLQFGLLPSRLIGSVITGVLTAPLIYWVMSRISHTVPKRRRSWL